MNLGKKYIVSYEKEALVRHIMPRFLRIKTYEELWALKEINHETKKGQTIGILGRNGAGKTTLLNIIAGITSPTQGKVIVNGKVSALLSLGAGFHPELTGEENIYINGSILGLKIREIKKRYKEIVDFSELGDFINTPLYAYSAGMYMRLGFAIAINVDFDILLMDEILTVGDISFQNKCLDKLKKFQQDGKTIVIVSQSLDLLNQLCHRVVLLDKGRILLDGRPPEVSDFYQRLMSEKTEFVTLRKPTRESAASSLLNSAEKESRENRRIRKDAWGTKSGTKEVEIVGVKLSNGRNKECYTYRTGERMEVDVRYIVHKEVEDPHFGIAIFKEDGTYCYGPNTRFDGLKIDRLRKGKGEFSIEYKNLNLLPGRYRISVAIWEREERFAYDNHHAFYKFKVISDKRDHGILYLNHRWRLS